MKFSQIPAIKSRSVALPSIWGSASLFALWRARGTSRRMCTLLLATRDRVLYHAVARSIAHEDFSLRDAFWTV